MNSAEDSNDDLVTTQEKLEWVTPKISLMVTEDTLGKGPDDIEDYTDGRFDPHPGPS